MVDIKGYEGLYAITSCGKVWGYKRKKFLKPTLTAQGRLRVGLYKDGKLTSYLIHRLVAEAYIPNHNGLPQVNHKDENPQHNWINNLEWCSGEYNLSYGTRLERSVKGHKKPIYCVELDKVFDSAADAARELGLDNSAIGKVCKGKKKTTGGYHFRYMEVA